VTDKEGGGEDQHWGHSLSAELQVTLPEFIMCPAFLVIIIIRETNIKEENRKLFKIVNKEK
jgi:hypothetical protein